MNKNEPGFYGWSRVAAIFCGPQASLKNQFYLSQKILGARAPKAKARVTRLMKARQWMLTEMPQMHLICRIRRLSIASSKCCRYVCRNIQPSWPAGLQQVFGIYVHSPTCPQISAETLERPVAHVITGCIWPGRSDINIRFRLY
jgi:hypothetical protein